jgi:hypothetical protein
LGELEKARARPKQRENPRDGGARITEMLGESALERMAPALHQGEGDEGLLFGRCKVKDELAIASAMLLTLIAVSSVPETAAPLEASNMDLVRVTEFSETTTAIAESPLTLLVHREHGATLSTSRYTLRIPPHALARTCTITLRACEEDGTVGCDILPLGLACELPAVLSVNLKGTNAKSSRQYVVCAWNPVTGGWEELGGRYDAGTGAVLTTVTRFTRFAVKESSW